MANHCWNWVEFEKDETRNWINKHLVREYDKYHFLTELPLNLTEEEIKSQSVYDLIGTKWIDLNTEIEDCDNEFGCDSAWSPPVGMLQRLSEMFQDTIQIEFEEPGCQVFGCVKFINGETVEETWYADFWKYSWEYLKDKEKILSELDCYDLISYQEYTYLKEKVGITDDEFKELEVEIEKEKVNG